MSSASTNPFYKIKQNIKMKIIIILSTFLLLCGFKEVDTVIRVIDGDTIETKNNGRVRILGIDAYDTNSRMVKKQKEKTEYSSQKIKDLSSQGKRFATQKLLGKQVVLEKDRFDKDKYNRKLRYVEVGGDDYSEKILKKGLANVYCDDNKIKKFDFYNKNSDFKCD